MSTLETDAPTSDPLEDASTAPPPPSRKRKMEKSQHSVKSHTGRVGRLLVHASTVLVRGDLARDRVRPPWNDARGVDFEAFTAVTSWQRRLERSEGLRNLCMAASYFQLNPP